MICLPLNDFYHSKKWYAALPAFIFDALELAFLAGFDHVLVTKSEYDLVSPE